jgi:hypothetical protein
MVNSQSDLTHVARDAETGEELNIIPSIDSMVPGMHDLMEEGQTGVPDGPFPDDPDPEFGPNERGEEKPK